MPGQYQYIRIGRSYFCLQQNPVVLMWFLYLKNESLGLGSLGLDRKRALNGIKGLVRRQLSLRSNASVLELPVGGDLCLSVHRGYRVFDFRRKTVTRVFAPEIDTDTVAREIEGVRSASSLDFTPNVQRWNIQERWYEEDFVIGCPGHSIPKWEPGAFWETYYQDIAPCIERMILLKAPSSADLGEYVHKASNSLQDDALLKKGVDVTKASTIKSFVKSVAERLYDERDCQIDLIFSHGDFSLVNILRTKDGVMVIDWESAGRRNVLFDLYNYFFTELYYERVTTTLVSEINDAISSLQSRLTAKAPKIARTLSSLAPMYRRLYYLERIVVLLEREICDKLLNVILRSIEVFNHYEDVVASD